MRHRLWILAAVVVLAVSVDLSRPPERQWATRAAVAGVHVYQATLSRLFAASGVACRFSPTCSHYAEACLKHYGLLRGGAMAVGRVLRCGPWTPMGTIDPPPPV